MRPVEFSDYGLTESGKLKSIPSDFKKLPYFIVEKLPKVLDESKNGEGILCKPES